MITVLPEGGLCNRMRVVASAWHISVATKQPMRVLWYRTPDFNSRFDSIFLSRDLPFEVVEKSAMLRPQRALFRTSEFFAKLRGQIVLNHEDTRPGKFDYEGSVRQLTGKDAWIRSNSRLVAASGMYSLFRPAGEAADRIANLLPRLGGSVGVHIRGTDNVKAKTESPLASFVAHMRAEITASPATNFFVATDEPDTLEKLNDEFGARVWEYPKRAYARNDQKAIVDAVVDLFALGECNKLIGSYWSSFTDTAAELKGIPCTIARAY